MSKRFKIKKIEPKGNLDGLRILAYGRSGVGKTTFWFNKKDAVWLAFETGQDFQKGSVAAYDMPEGSAEAHSIIKDYLTEDRLQFPYLIFDGLGYEFAAQKIDSWKTGEGSWGKDKHLTPEKYRQILESFKKKNAGLISIVHSSEASDPDDPEKTLIFPSFEKSKPSHEIIGLFDIVMYFYIDRAGKYKIRTKGLPNVVTKDRTETLGYGGLPAVMDQNYDQFMAHLKKAIGVKDAK